MSIRTQASTLIRVASDTYKALASNARLYRRISALDISIDMKEKKKERREISADRIPELLTSQALDEKNINFDRE